MHPDLRQFVANFLGTVALALIVVVLTLFVSLPMNMVRAPADAVGPAAPERHLT